MPYVQLGGLQYPLEPGENPVGAAPDARIGLKGVDYPGVFAILELTEDGSVIVRRTAELPILVNGQDILDQPSPLIHGDKLEILGREMHFGDDRRIGSTAFVPRVTPSPNAGPRVVTEPTASTGGRLVSLVDGREYAVPDDGLVLGRDPDCHVVIPSTDVSRRHAVIAPTPDGYVLTDSSTNGVLVNGARVEKTQVLGRGDLIRIADEEFRFRADAAPPGRRLFGILEVRGSTALAGRRFEVRSTVVRIGRGEHNDIVLPDESVSDAHAVLQLREQEGWCVVDLESTNGTYVRGNRVHGMSPIGAAAELRFASIKLIFRAEEEMRKTTGKGTRVIAPARAGERDAMGRPTTRSVRAQTGSQPVQQHRSAVPPVIWILLGGLIAIVFFIFLTSF